MKKNKEISPKLNLENTRIIFMGTSYFSKEILKILIGNQAKIELVITQPDKLSGRKKEIEFSAVKKYCLKEKLKILQPEILDEKILKKITEIKPDIILVASYGLIIPKTFFEKLTIPFVNIHPSLLPKLRGASPIQTTLLKGIKKTGISLMEMEAGVDSGNIIFQKEIPVQAKEKYPELEKKIIAEIAKFFPQILTDYLEKKITPQSQKNSEATFTKIINKKDGKINWDSTAKDISNKFKAYYQWPQIYAFWETKKGSQKIIITALEIDEKNEQNKKNGQVYRFGKKIKVKTKKGSLILKKIKLAGKKEAFIEDFVNGYPKFIESILK